MVSEDVKMGRDMDNNKKWRKDNLKACVLYFHKANDKDVLDHLERQPNKRAYIINLIREDINRGGN